MAKRMLYVIALLVLLALLAVLIVLLALRSNGLTGNGVYFVERGTGLCR